MQSRHGVIPDHPRATSFVLPVLLALQPRAYTCVRNKYISTHHPLLTQHSAVSSLVWFRIASRRATTPVSFIASLFALHVHQSPDGYELSAHNHVFSCSLCASLRIRSIFCLRIISLGLGRFSDKSLRSRVPLLPSPVGWALSLPMQTHSKLADSDAIHALVTKG